MCRARSVVMSRKQRHCAQLLDAQKAGTQTIIDVVVVVGDLVGDVRDLCFESRLRVIEEALPDLTEHLRVAR
jgi:hypothetical protein